MPTPDRAHIARLSHMRNHIKSAKTMTCGSMSTSEPIEVHALIPDTKKPDGHMFGHDELLVRLLLLLKQQCVWRRGRDYSSLLRRSWSNPRCFQLFQ